MKYNQAKTNVLFQFNKMLKAKKVGTGLSEFCQVCQFLKTPDSVQKFPSLDEVPLKYRVIMTNCDAQPTICYYCKEVLSKGKIPITNEFASDASHSRFLNTNMVKILTSKIEDKFRSNIYHFGKERQEIWNKRNVLKNWDFTLIATLYQNWPESQNTFFFFRSEKFSGKVGHTI